MNKNEQTYWNNFYNNKSQNISNCSGFCDFIMEYFKNKNNILNVLDCGCGNGRDSFKLSEKYNVKAIDNSGFVPNNKDNLIFECDDFVDYNKKGYDIIYSRFTFHSITNEQHNNFLNSIENDSYLCIETRSDKGENEYVYHGKTHYRNYTNIEYLKKILNEHKFNILYIEEKNDMAKYKDEDPICIRVICVKQV
tara:strand:- start:25 stop:606 length:582 start_codon:yes stop_codon:yes gene_type:complete